MRGIMRRKEQLIWYERRSRSSETYGKLRNKEGVDSRRETKAEETHAEGQ